VEEAGGDMDVVISVRGRHLEEVLPVGRRGLVGTELAGDDRQVERTPSRFIDSFDQCGRS
jgi:hypothetical protein